MADGTSEAPARPAVKEGLERTESDDGLVIYDEATERVHHLNPTAAVILELCDATRTVEEIAETFGRLYPGVADPARQVSECLDELVREDLISL
jgi:Coenzyme PQQ synthesis protein D (PqqD)